MHLKHSKGSRQSRQRCSALQGVEPNWLVHSVRIEPQRGHAMGAGRVRGSGAAVAGGGTIP
jgi:hypothetical protein